MDAFLSQFHDCPYTVILVSAQGRVQLWPYHYDRLKSSSKNFTKNSDELLTEIAEFLKKQQLKTIQTRVAIVITMSESLYFYAEPRKELKARSATACIYPKPDSRLDLHLKTTSWVAQRQAIWQEVPRDCEEVLLLVKLADGTLIVSEGTSSNLILIDQNDQVCTTTLQLVLPGTVLQALMEKVHVKQKLMTVENLFAMKMLILSSTSRHLLPVSRLYVHDGKQHEYITESPAFDSLKVALAEEIEASSPYLPAIQ